MVFDKHIKKNIRGFSIVEMLVSIAVVALILAVVVINQGDFTDTFSLGTNASDFELQVRQAQIYGVAVKEFTPSSNEFTSPYGVSVNIAPGGGNSFYITFADRNKNDDYDGGSSCVVGGESECINRFNFTRNVVINQVCALKPNSQADCAPLVGRADITFIRPDPTAHLSLFNSVGNPTSITNVIGVKVEFLSPKGKTKSVYIYTTGQISV